MALVLILDDRPDDRELIRLLVDDAGHRSADTGDAREAMTILDREPVALVVVDLMMPAVDGWEFVERLRAHPRYGAIPTIVHSSMFGDDIADIAAELGCRFVPKASDPSVLREAIGAALDGNAG